MAVALVENLSSLMILDIVLQSHAMHQHFHKSKALYWGKPFQRAALFQKAYLTDLLQEMVNLGVPIHCVIIARGWKEIDTIEDYENAITKFNDD